jgi:type VI secretion system protein ImpK
MKTQSLPENSVLLMQFRHFVSELITVKQRMEQGFPTPPETLSQTALLEKFPGIDIEMDRARFGLVALLEQQSMRVQDISGSLAFSLYREAEYVMASLADELMLNAEWAGRLHWKLLEEEIFKTRASGETFFTRLDRLLAPNAVPSRELAMIYLQALALDFRGKFRGRDPHNQLAHYRRQLYDRIFQRKLERDNHDLLFPQSYTIESEAESARLASPHLWWLVLAGVLVVWLLVSTVLWRTVASPLQGHLQRIQQLSASSTKATP